MAKLVWKNCKIYFHEFDLSGYHNEMTVTAMQEILDGTAYGDTTRSRVSGYKSHEGTLGGWWDAGSGTPDTELFDDMGTASRILTFAPTGTDGDSAYICKGVQGSYNPMGQEVGELQRFTWVYYSENDLRRGTIMHNATRTTTGTGTIRQLGALTSSQTMYAAFHCYAASAGDTLDVIVQSDANQAFGSPTTRITFSQVTGGTEYAEWDSVSGKVSDNWWRVSYTIAGVSPSFGFIVTLAIGPGHTGTASISSSSSSSSSSSASSSSVSSSSSSSSA